MMSVINTNINMEEIIIMLVIYFYIQHIFDNLPER